MNYEDRITKSYLEDALAGAGVKIAYGTYAGNGAVSRTIDVGFYPKAVFVVDSSGVFNTHIATFGGLAVRGSSVSTVQLVSNGFVVTNPENIYNNARSNDPDKSYQYLAIG